MCLCLTIFFALSFNFILRSPNSLAEKKNQDVEELGIGCSLPAEDTVTAKPHSDSALPQPPEPLVTQRDGISIKLNLHDRIHLQVRIPLKKMKYYLSFFAF